MLHIFQDGATALFKACHKGHAEIVEELLKYEPNLSLLPVSLKQVCYCTCISIADQNYSTKYINI